MSLAITKVELRYEQDVVCARQLARAIAVLLGFEPVDQTRISTAVSEITRHAFACAAGGSTEFSVEEKAQPQIFMIRIAGRGKGMENVASILDGNCPLPSDMEPGISLSRKFMDRFSVISAPENGFTVEMGKAIPSSAPAVTERSVMKLQEALFKQKSQNPYEEIRHQNQEILGVMEELRLRGEELERLNGELEDTNRGVVALYAELEEKAEDEHRANEMKTMFLSSTSHEFRTPLNSILALSGILLERFDGDLSPAQEEQVNYIRSAALSLSTLVNDFLDIAKIEAGKETVNHAFFEAAILFSALRGMLRPLFTSDEVQFIVEEPQGIPPLYSDEGKISQILRNLISNAIKFTEKGAICIKAALDGEKRQIIFSVQDTGRGIAAEHHEFIFQEFAQVGGSTRKKTKGSGLGLPLSRKLARLLGGDLSLQSAPGEGSTFYLSLPLSAEEQDIVTIGEKASARLDSASMTKRQHGTS